MKDSHNIALLDFDNTEREPIVQILCDNIEREPIVQILCLMTVKQVRWNVTQEKDCSYASPSFIEQNSEVGGIAMKLFH